MHSHWNPDPAWESFPSKQCCRPRLGRAGPAADDDDGVTYQVPSPPFPCCALILMPQWSLIMHRKEISSFHHSSHVVLSSVESPNVILSAVCPWVCTQSTITAQHRLPWDAEPAQAGAGHSHWAGWKFWHSPCLLEATIFLPRKISLPPPHP